MFIAILILAISVSIDSFGIGITYGIRNTLINKSANIILFSISLLFAGISILIGNMLFSIMSESVIKFISIFLLIAMGIWIIYETIRPEKVVKEKIKNNSIIHQIFLKPFGITIQIIKNPINSDLNKSNIIEVNEAIYLAVALSIDSICVGISSASFGLYGLLFPILVPIFQLVFLNTGLILGKKIISSSFLSLVPHKLWNTLSGVLLIIIGISRFFI